MHRYRWFLYLLGIRIYGYLEDHGICSFLQAVVGSNRVMESSPWRWAPTESLTVSFQKLLTERPDNFISAISHKSKLLAARAAFGNEYLSAIQRTKYNFTTHITSALLVRLHSINLGELYINVLYRIFYCGPR